MSVVPLFARHSLGSKDIRIAKRGIRCSRNINHVWCSLTIVACACSDTVDVWVLGILKMEWVAIRVDVCVLLFMSVDVCGCSSGVLHIMLQTGVVMVLYGI